jgi:hypothetical protein
MAPRPHSRTGWLLVAAGVSAVVAASCGADDAIAPRPVVNSAACRDFDQLMPNLVKALSTGRTENLKFVVEKYLLAEDPTGGPPPINDVLRAIFATVNGFTRGPAELGAPKDELCAPTPPALDSVNGLCELRRTLDLLIHEGKGIDAIAVIDPQVTSMINYLIGKGKDGTPHYETVNVVTKMCSQDIDCQLADGLDLIIALSTFLATPRGKQMGDNLQALATKGTITSFLDPNSLTEDQFVAIARALVTAILGSDANALDNLPLPQSVMTDLKPVLDDLKLIIDPNFRPNIIGPTKKALNCLNKKDTNYDIVRAVYRLALRDKLPEFGLTRLVGIISGLQQVDQRGSLIYLMRVMAQAVRADEQAIDSAARVCRTVLSTKAAAGQARSNAELVLPVAQELFAGGIVNETICAVDTLIYGCAGGKPQPACGIK